MVVSLYYLRFKDEGQGTGAFGSYLLVLSKFKDEGFDDNQLIL